MASTRNDVEKAAVEANHPSRAFRSHTPSRIGDAGPLGLFAFASTTFILSWYNTGVRGITHPNVVVGMAVAGGGLAQLLAGMWEFPRGNCFAGSAFTSFGAFWISYALILIPGTGVIEAYGTDADEFGNAIGIYLITWFIITFLFFIATLRKNLGFITMFFFLWVTFIVLAANAFTGKVGLQKAGGILGIITALVAFYNGLSILLAAEESPIFRLPLGVIPKRID
ncbi:hypothetical protein AX14_008594 [Amanita brunnescens Koide BX004]|jgi:succinate-acetate transporter protein|nr:hypothetical protein AX14_008594 [Amanita brunnescens Koide BX004]